jgi:hypothetical protein
LKVLLSLVSSALFGIIAYGLATTLALPALSTISEHLDLVDKYFILPGALPLLMKCQPIVIGVAVFLACLCRDAMSRY